jgi:hypothetical protein
LAGFPIGSKMRRPGSRKGTLILLWILVLALCAWQMPGFWRHLGSDSFGTDFIAYWTSARLMLAGENPYSAAQIFTLQKLNGWTRETPLVMYNHPWALGLIFPFSMPNYVLAKFLWLCFLTILLALCAVWLWRFYGGGVRDFLCSLLLLYSFFPIFLALFRAQIVPFVLVGLAGFLYFERRHQYFLAGICISLMALKPHTLYLFWVALLFWVIDNRQWAVLAGALLAGLGLCAIPFFYNPEIFRLYLETIVMGQSPYLSWHPPTLGTFLRLLFGERIYWLQFIPPLTATVFFVFYWSQKRTSWSWEREMPRIIFMSLLTTFYVWGSDYALLIVGILQAAIGWLKSQSISAVPRTFFWVFIPIVVLGWGVHFWLQNEQWFIGSISALYLIYLWLFKHFSTANGSLYHPAIAR